MSERDSTCAVEYRPIPNFDGYAVGSDGTIWSSRPHVRSSGERMEFAGLEWVRIKPEKTSHGYWRIRLYQNGKSKQLPVAHAVLFAFVGPKPKDMECCHHDGSRTNNTLANLRWDTPYANYLDRVRHNMVAFGEFHASTMISEDAVEMVRKLWLIGFKQRDIAAGCGMSQTHVSNLISGHTREGVSPTQQAASERLSSKERREWLRDRYSSKKTHAATNIMWLLEQIEIMERG